MSEPLAERLIAGLRAQRATVATAESLTGGLIGQLLTDVPGASAVYRGGVISYATDLKHTLAGVSLQTLADHGPVAEQTAREMAVGVAERCGARLGLAVTGVAGPEPQGQQPVGEVFVAVVDRDADVVDARKYHLEGTRTEIRRETARRALALLAEHLGRAAGQPQGGPA